MATGEDRAMRRACGWISGLLLAGCATAPAVPDRAPAHLERSGAQLRTVDAVPLSVRVPGFRLAGPSHRRAEFDGRPYEVSLGAYLAGDEAVMVHGERVADSSGASDYDALPAADWPKPGFRLRGYCVTIPAEEVGGEHDLAWLRAHGWEPSGTLAMDQYLATTPDHNREVVLSLVVRGVDCADKPAVARRLEALRAKVRVRLP
jgi:hypothetical protein